MNEISIFTSPEFGKIRTVTLNGEPWFVGKDVAVALGYAKARNAIATHVDEEDKTPALIQGGCSTGSQTTIVINESGLYSLILSSKLPSAKAFKRWITAEVLPQLRKTGTYGSINLEEVITKTAVAVVSEMMKALVPFLTEEKPLKETCVKRKPEATMHIKKAYRYTPPSKISTLSPKLREQVDEMIISGEYSCQQIANFIMNNSDIKISQMAVSRYKHTHFILIEK